MAPRSPPAPASRTAAPTPAPSSTTPTGNHAEWLGIAIYTLRDDRITDAWFAEDILGLLIQLGAIAPPARTVNDLAVQG